MVEYLCEDCEKVFTQKSHYDSHKKRKIPCKTDSKIDKLIEKKVREVLAKSHNTISVQSIDPQTMSISTSTKISIIKPF